MTRIKIIQHLFQIKTNKSSNYMSDQNYTSKLLGNCAKKTK